MAATAIFLQLRPNRHRLHQNPNFINFFSSSSSSSSDESPSSPPEPQPQPQPQPQSFASYFNNVKSSLKQSPSSQQRQQQQPPRPFYPSSSNTNESLSRVSSIEEVRRNLSEYRRRTTTPNLSQQQPISFQELYQRSVSEKNDLASTNVAGRTGQLSLNEIRQSLMRKTTSPPSQGEGPKMMSLDRLKESLKLRPQQENNDKLPLLVETETRNTKAESDAMKTEFVRSYSYTELGNKLRTLRPEGKGKNLFSLTELNERLRKMRELEVKETDSRVGGPFYKDIRESLVKLQLSDSDKVKKNISLSVSVLSRHGKNAEFMLKPPKKELVEKYFHPDNMSSSEKLKIELKRVRDEFKISESDCGSARVQVAQLTTKIKHLSAALHKKDKHSRKGLQGMVQQRKKLLKYLRRTDWDSYCLVLSKLGLRDNPDYKN